MDFALLPPEINSARMYTGPGAGPLTVGAIAWDGLAAEMNSAAAGYAATISELTATGWQGPSSSAMAAAAEPYIAWMTDAAVRAQQAGLQTKQLISAYETAFAMTVPPPVIAANRSLLAMLVATNIIGQNAAAIAATEADYAEMWSQDVAAMYGYAGAAAAASTVTPLAAADDTTNPQGPLGAILGDIVTETESRIETLVAVIPNALQELATASSPASALSALSGILSGIGGANVFGYPVAMVPAVAALGSINLGNGIKAKVVSGTRPVPSPAPGATPGHSPTPRLTNIIERGPVGQVGRAATVGALSVPRSWVSAAPAYRLADYAVAAVPLESGGDSTTLFNELGLAGIGGRVIGAHAIRSRGPAQERLPAGPPATPVDSLEALHEAIIRDALAGAEFLGGFSSSACQRFIADIGNNFAIIYEHTRESSGRLTAAVEEPR